MKFTHHEPKDITQVHKKQEKENTAYINQEETSLNELTFPRRIIGDVEKRGTLLGFYHHRYLELDSKHGLIRRYLTTADFPDHPKEVLRIDQLTSLLKIKREQNTDYYMFKLLIDIGEGKTVTHIYRVKHLNSRTQWFDAIKMLWLHFKRGEPLPPLTKETLFIDDNMGIMHNLKKQSESESKGIQITAQDYDFGKIIGYGAFSTVYHVYHKKTKRIYAMKVMDKNILIHKKHLHYIMTEYSVLKQVVQCPFILNLHSAFQSSNYLYMVIDYCSGGDLTSIEGINNKKLLYAELILAFEYLHNKGIIYRDIKPENILLSEEGHIKLCDFNLAKEGIKDNVRAPSFCGSPLYLSPEMLGSGGVGKAADVFGIGLIMYEIETGVPAFYSKTTKDLYEKISNVSVNYTHHKIDEDILELIKNILVKNEHERFTLEDIKSHRYFKGFDWEKTKRRENGLIKIIKRKDKKRNANGDIWNENGKHNKRVNKISRREIRKDVERKMKNKVRNFDFVSEEISEYIRGSQVEDEEKEEEEVLKIEDDKEESENSDDNGNENYKEKENDKENENDNINSNLINT